MEFDALKDLIVDTLACDADKVTPEASLIDDLDADSLSIVELHMAIEEETGISIPDEEVANLKTVQDVLDCIKKHQ
ncbi:MAG: acyl carrier protein [Lachnospiraceae bacterium]|nr:acyl carrier protein [Lachnospiraceae bacterium]